MQHDFPHTRWASPHEGPVLGALFLASGANIATWIDWSRPLAQNWLIAESTSIRGCLMVNFGAPIGRLDYMVLHPSCSHKERAVVTKALAYEGMAQLKQHGSQYVACMASDAYPQFASILQKRGGVITDHGPMIMKRID